MQIQQWQRVYTYCLSFRRQLHHSSSFKNRKAETITKTWQTIHNMFTQAGVAPNTYVMDNEISSDFITALTKTTLLISLSLHIHIIVT